MSERFACDACGISLPEITPRLFSFNGPEGACPACGGLGEARSFEASLVVPDPSLSIEDGAVAAWGKPNAAYHRHALHELADAGVGVPVDVPFDRLRKKQREALLQGVEGAYEGVLPGLERRLHDYDRRKREQGASEEEAFEYLEAELGRFASHVTCPSCGGARLRPEALAVTVAGHTIHALSTESVHALATFFASRPRGTARGGGAPDCARSVRSAALPHRRRPRLPHARP